MPWLRAEDGTPLYRLVPHAFPAPPFHRYEMERASGDCECETCGLLYYDHPPDREDLGWDGEPYLNVLCDGRRVHL